MTFLPPNTNSQTYVRTNAYRLRTIGRVNCQGSVAILVIGRCFLSQPTCGPVQDVKKKRHSLNIKYDRLDSIAPCLPAPRSDLSFNPFFDEPPHRAALHLCLEHLVLEYRLTAATGPTPFRLGHHYDLHLDGQPRWSQRRGSGIVGDSRVVLVSHTPRVIKPLFIKPDPAIVCMTHFSGKSW